jgi:hypothetical protein
VVLLLSVVSLSTGEGVVLLLSVVSLSTGEEVVAGGVALSVLSWSTVSATGDGVDWVTFDKVDWLTCDPRS